MMSETEINRFCALDSQETGQAIIGTASADTAIWLLLEYPEPWAAKALANNNLPDTVQTWLQTRLKEIERSRLVFIKKSNQKRDRYSFYVGIGTEASQRLYRFQLSDYEALFEIDIAAVVAGAAEFEQNLSDETLYLVCTNGKRDRCCSKFGLPIYHALSNTDTDGVSAWQCTHLGGHRYAPVVGVVPAGLTYRVVRPEDGLKLVQSMRQNKILLDGYRGRNCYNGVTQAADLFLRQRSGELGLNRYRLQDIAVDQGLHQVRFVEHDSGVGHTIELKMSLTEPLLAGCGAVEKTKPQPHYQFVDYQVEEASCKRDEVGE